LPYTAVSKSLDYLHQLDNAFTLSYDAWNSNTKAYSYQLSFAVVVAGATVILYALLLVVKLAGMSLSGKVQEILYGSAAVLQFALAVLLAITQSRQVDPYGPNGSTVSANCTSLPTQPSTRPTSTPSWPIPSSSGSCASPDPTSSHTFTHSPPQKPLRLRPVNWVSGPDLLERMDDMEGWELYTEGICLLDGYEYYYRLN
jgi:hypothetical protein